MWQNNACVHHGTYGDPLALNRIYIYIQCITIKGPDNPTSQLLPIMSFKGCSGDGEGRKDKGGGEGSKS